MAGDDHLRGSNRPTLGGVISLAEKKRGERVERRREWEEENEEDGGRGGGGGLGRVGRGSWSEERWQLKG